jgi:hypothetical protein
MLQITQMEQNVARKAMVVLLRVSSCLPAAGGMVSVCVVVRADRHTDAKVEE